MARVSTEVDTLLFCAAAAEMQELFRTNETVEKKGGSYEGANSQNSANERHRWGHCVVDCACCRVGVDVARTR